MSGINQVSTDLKKFIDATMYAYQPKEKRLRSLYSTLEVDPSQVTYSYTKLTQTYAEARGYEMFATSTSKLADGSAPAEDSGGSEDGTSTQSTYGRAFTIDRKLLSSSLPYQKQFVARHSVDMLGKIENDVNVALNTNMASNAAQTYTATGGTWATTGDPVSDVNAAKNTFKLRSGGIDADFIAVHPNEHTDIANDFRFQSTLYVNEKQLESGAIAPKPLGLEWVVDAAVTTGTFFLGKKGMFGQLIISENYKTFEVDLGARGKRYEAVFSYTDQYVLPYYLLYGTGI